MFSDYNDVRYGGNETIISNYDLLHNQKSGVFRPAQLVSAVCKR